LSYFEYDTAVATQKVSLSLDEELVAAARQHGGRRGLSGYVNEALRRQLQRDRLIELLDDAEQDVGPIGDDVMEEVRRAWPDGGRRQRRSA
jgi:Arc/MetJ family transcription regulator